VCERCAFIRDAVERRSTTHCGEVLLSQAPQRSTGMTGTWAAGLAVVQPVHMLTNRHFTTLCYRSCISYLLCKCVTGNAESLDGVSCQQLTDNDNNKTCNTHGTSLEVTAAWGPLSEGSEVQYAVVGPQGACQLACCTCRCCTPTRQTCWTGGWTAMWQGWGRDAGRRECGIGPWPAATAGGTSGRCRVQPVLVGQQQ
jgi:hypothetical protein